MNHTTPQEHSTQAPLPLFYKKPVLLNFDSHRNCGVTANNGFSFAREAAAVPVCASEFVEASRHYPLVFGEVGTPNALAVLGVEQGRNLIVDEDGNWRADYYQPAYVRRYPFTVAEVVDKQKQLLAIDSASDRFVEASHRVAGVSPLFDESGAASSTAKSAIEFCCLYHREHVSTVGFVQALEQQELLVSKHATSHFGDGSSYKLDGFRVVDERKLRNLPAGVVCDWHSRGWLDLVVLHMASQRNWQSLLSLRAGGNVSEPNVAMASRGLTH